MKGFMVLTMNPFNWPFMAPPNSQAFSAGAFPERKKSFIFFDNEGFH
jgi:hypothetical protein